MFSKYNKLTTIIAVLLVSVVVLFLAWLAYNRFHEHHSQLSVKPPSQFSNITLEPIESTLGLHAKLPYSTLQQAAEQATQHPQTGNGERQTCKRILGAKACATLQWQYRIERAGAVKISRNDQAVRLTLPLSLNGTAGIDGRGGKLFGLRNKKFSGLVELTADLDFSMGEDWCPNIQSSLSHQWLTDPRIQVAGKIKINLRKSADKAIKSRLKKLEDKLSNLIDCSQFRTAVAENWRVHHLPINVPGQQQSYLELVPLTVAIAPVQPQDDHITLAIELSATTEVVNNQTRQTPLVLPRLLPDIVEPGAVEFSVLINLTYPQIKELVSEKLLGNVQDADGKHFTINSFDLYPADDKLIFNLGFKATGFGRFLKSSGQLYLSARPVADPQSNELRFEDLQFTRIIDSELWSVLSTVLHQRILDTLNDAAVIDLAPQVRKLEKSIVDTLSDPEKTAQIRVVASAPEVRLVAVNPQQESLAAIIHISTRLDATIPPSALFRK